MTTKVFDVETSRFPSGNPHTVGTLLCSWATKELGPTPRTESRYYEDADFLKELREQLQTVSLVVGINLKFDFAWLTKYGIKLPKGCRVWDCQLAEFILSGQRNSFASMDSLCALYDLPNKQGGLTDYWDAGINTQEIPRDVVLEYNVSDLDRTESIYLHQLKDPRMNPELHTLILLCGSDLKVLEQMESNGLKYDVASSEAEAERLEAELLIIDKELRGLSSYSEINFDSGIHLSCFLYGGTIAVDVYEPVVQVLKSGPRKGETRTIQKFIETEKYTFEGYFKPLKGTLVKSCADSQGVLLPGVQAIYQTAEPILLQLKARSRLQKRIIQLLLLRAEKDKLVGTYFRKIPELLKEKQWGDIVHGTYNQVVARTGRLSSSAP
jgi:DNA polymerase I-like protein with 3'-5' exonuclease and polymerase domains